MKTVKSNVRRSLCQREGLIFQGISGVEEGAEMGKIRLVAHLGKGHAEICN